MGKYSEALKGLTASVEYFAQIAMRRFVGDAIDRMERVSMTKAQLADRLGTSPAYVSRVMKGDVNFTLETMTKIAMATGGRLDVRIVDSHTITVRSTLDALGVRELAPVMRRPAALAVAAVTQSLSIDPANEETYEASRYYRVACG
jgi:transcriptional regulator with XRE-family HTH domain